MSYVPLTSTEIEVGESVKNDTLDKVKQNFENHETRINSIETGSVTVYPPIILRVNGDANLFGAVDNVLKTTCNFNLTITGIRLIVDQAGSSGNTEIDIKFKRGGGAYTSVLTTKPKCNYQDGNDYASANSANGSLAAVLNPVYVNLEAGDLIRLDLTSIQTAGDSFFVRIDYSKT